MSYSLKTKGWIYMGTGSILRIHPHVFISLKNVGRYPALPINEENICFPGKNRLKFSDFCGFETVRILLYY